MSRLSILILILTCSEHTQLMSFLTLIELVRNFVEENGEDDLGTVEKFYYVMSQYFPDANVFILRLELMLHLYRFAFDIYRK